MGAKRARYNSDVANLIDRAFNLLSDIAGDAIAEALRGTGDILEKFIIKRLEEINEFLKTYNKLATELRSEEMSLPIINPVEISHTQPLDQLVELLKEGLKKVEMAVEVLLQLSTS
ncbi:hypothetical protein [Pyrobaculum aerophilum]|uniref:Uncharacterized protein n=1 Tax=Pyrobaculum aerophilum TaxID=13773 RepID=A0A371QXT5_9CREN|nr:hypothetical protein [Pyrobaculum aerophilum]RFA93457.1 hypothetical protein CGL51_12955 [Pyrobaculum aerophilum]RFA95352.1 hypothetical protein CGL52_12985 [Pyrobaculum aerophilum]